MAQMQLHTTCDDCVKLVQHAATILSEHSSDEIDISTFYDSQYQSRLLANVAASKCHLCVLLHKHISGLSEPLEPDKDLQISVFRSEDDPTSVEIGLRALRKDTGSMTNYPGRLRVHKDGHVNVQFPISSQTWSLESLDCIRSWLQSCTSCHDACLKPQGSRTLPLRLIDVNTAGTIQNQPPDKIGPEEFDRLRLRNCNGVRIISTQLLSSDTEYLTLSHRWGSTPGLVLSRQSLLRVADDISPHVLNCAEAAVFEHAIHVTRCLGFRYIWVDALCIMQDDNKEKGAEIMRMDDIYYNSDLNISAAEADILNGLVFDRQPLLTTPCTTTARVSRSKEDVPLHVFGKKFFLFPKEKPLNRRGWVFQERTISPRIVHFTEDQVFWECWSLKASEILPEALPSSTTKPFDKSIGIGTTTFDVQEIKSKWYQIVDVYSHTSLSFADDRLLALSAVAKRFCSAMRMDPSEYLAGMWKDDLPQSLLWSQEPIHGRSGPAETGSDLVMKYAPSWSWASLMVEITPIGLSSIPDTITFVNTEVVNVQGQRRSRNFFDGTDRCQLHLRGPMCKFRRHLQDGSPFIHITRGDVFQELASYRSYQRGRSIILFWDTARNVTADMYFLLHILTDESAGENHERGLILVRISERGTYKRIGTFFIPASWDFAGSKVENAFKSGLDTLSTEDYLAVGSDGKYTIIVI